jgi:hypothetical protein
VRFSCLYPLIQVVEIRFLLSQNGTQKLELLSLKAIHKTYRGHSFLPSSLMILIPEMMEGKATQNDEVLLPFYYTFCPSKVFHGCSFSIKPKHEHVPYVSECHIAEGFSVTSNFGYLKIVPFLG